MTSNVYFQSIDPQTVRASAQPLSQSLSPPLCGRGRHLVRTAMRDGSVQVASLADYVAIEPAKIRGYVRQKGGAGRFVATDKGIGYLQALARVE